MVFSDKPPEKQFCIRCNEPAIKETDDEGRTWVLNLIGIALDFFIEDYPELDDMCGELPDYAIDLCEKCEKEYWKKGFKITLDEIKTHAYRFV